MLGGELQSALFKGVAVAALFFAWTTYQRADAKRDCQEAQLRVELEIANRNLVAAQDIAGRAASRAAEAEREVSALEVLKNELETRDESGVCTLSDRDRERLRAIR